MTDLNTAKINSLVQDVQQLRLRLDGFAVVQEVIEARLKALEDVENYRQQDEDVERALAPMAQPEPKELTDEEILRIAAKMIEPYETCGIAVGEYEAETECAIEVYGSELIAFAHAVLDRWGQDQQNKEAIND